MDLFAAYGGEPAFLAAHRVQHDRRAAIESILAAPHHLTDVLTIADLGLQTEVREVLTGVRRVGRRPEFRHGLMSRGTYRMRTVDGRPFGGLKIEPVEGNARQLRRLSMMGQPLARTMDLGAEFDVDAFVGLMLLSQHGYGLTRPRYWRRNAEASGEKDSAGRPVLRVDRWRAVEVGSVMDAMARRNGDIVDAAPRPRRAAGGEA